MKRWIRHAILPNGKLAVGTNLSLINLSWGDSRKGSTAEKSFKIHKTVPSEDAPCKPLMSSGFYGEMSTALSILTDIFRSLILPDVFADGN